jgi:hypothetical protein
LGDEMSSRDLLQELAEGRAIKIVIEGDGASMRGVVRHGCVLTLTPVQDFREVQAGEIVLTRWRGGNHLLHLVREIKDDQFLIVNGSDKINGWVHGNDILGRVTEIQDTGETDISELVSIHQHTAKTFIVATQTQPSAKADGC